MRFSEIKAMADYQIKRANAIMNNDRGEDVDTWCDRIDEWCEDYECGVFDHMDDVYYASVMRDLYHKMTDKLDEIADLMYDEWYADYSQCH